MSSAAMPLFSPQRLVELRAAALSYLQEQLRDRAPASADFAAAFDESPLDGEGPAALFRFELRPGGPAGACAADDALRHFVVVGETAPNYSPAFGLSDDDAYSLHIGTRFLLEMGLEKLDADQAGEPLRATAERLARDCNPTATIADVQCVLAFRCQESIFGVVRLSIGAQPVYAIIGDVAPGFVEQVDHPPQMALRLHLGRVIRAEARTG